MTRITVPPTMMERVEHIPTSSVPLIRTLDVPPFIHAHDVVGPNAMTFGAALIEAVASAFIEGIEVSITQAALAVWQPRHPYVTDAGRTVAAALSATQDAVSGSASYADHSTAHSRLMRAQRTPRFAGFRKSIVRVSDHVAPAPRRIAELMHDLSLFIATRDDTVVHAAIAHAQFETIHPYADGNGRIGRALLSGHMGIPISRYLARHRQDYYDALRDFRLGDATAIVDIVGAAALDGFELIENTYDDDSYPFETDDLADLSPETREVANRIRLTPVGTRWKMTRNGKALTSAFEEMLDAGIITRVSRTGEHEVFAYLPVVNAWADEAVIDTRVRAQSAHSWKRALSVHV